MAEPYFQNLFAERIGGSQYGKSTQIYKFEKIKRAKRAAREQYPDRLLLDFGIGENDDMAADTVRAALKIAVDDPATRGYADNGIQEFKDAAARYMQREFGVHIDPKTEVNHSIGSKNAYALLPAIFINPGDVTLMTSPGYPVAGTHTKYYGGEVYNLPLRKENGFFPDLQAIPADICKRAKLLVINFPNSPTGVVATPDFYREVIDFAKRNQIVVVQDAAHGMLSYSGRPFSFLEVDGARDVGVEVHSLSKGWNMIGWRMGFVVGNERIVRAFGDVKDNSDSGQFIAVQRAAATALDDPEIPKRVRAKYRRRLEKLVAVLQENGFDVAMPGGTYFLYAPAPRANAKGLSFATAEDASQYLIREHSIITVPWDDAGAYLRFSVTYDVRAEKQLAAGVGATEEKLEDAMMHALAERLRNEAFRF